MNKGHDKGQMSDREAMRLALEALDTLPAGTSYKTHNAASALRKALEQPKQEPAAWSVPGFGFLFPDEYSAQRYLNNVESAAKPTPLYTAPPKRKWVGLTDEELRHAYGEVSGNEWCLGGISNAETFCDIIEAKLKEKNRG